MLEGKKNENQFYFIYFSISTDSCQQHYRYQAVPLDTLRDRMQRVSEDHPEMTTQLQDEALSVFDTFTDPFPTTAYGQNRIIHELFGPEKK